MTFSCNRCKTRYHISDDKVRGKILQIRCKACQNIVEIRDPNLAVPTPASDLSSMSLLGIAAVPKGESGRFPALKNAPTLKPASKPATTLPPPYPNKVEQNEPSSPSVSQKQYTSSSRLPIPKPQSPPIPKPNSVSKSTRFATPPPKLRTNSSSKLTAANTSRSSSPPPISLPVSPKERKIWHISLNGQPQKGPYSTLQLGDFLQNNTMKADDLVWCPEQVEWKKACEAERLASFFPKTVSSTTPPSLPEEDAKNTASLEFVETQLEPSLQTPSEESETFVAALEKEALQKKETEEGVGPPLPFEIPISSSQESLPIPETTLGSSVSSPEPADMIEEDVSSKNSLDVNTETAPAAIPVTPAVPPGFPAEQDIFASVPDAPGFQAPPPREMSALIPVSATKPSLQKRFWKPVVIGLSFVAVAIISYYLGYQDGSIIGNDSEKTAQIGTSDTQPTGLAPKVSDYDLDKLGGMGDETPIENAIGKDPGMKTGGVGNQKSSRPPKISNDTKSQTAEEQKKKLELFSGLGKSTALPKGVETKNPKEKKPLTAAERAMYDDAMKLVESSQAGATRCLQRALTGGEVKTETRLNISLQINTIGQVSSVSVKNAPSGSSLAPCLKSHYSRISFRKVGGPLTLNFPMIVSPML